MAFHRTSIKKHPKFSEKYIVTNYAGDKFTVTGKREANRIAASKKVVKARRSRMGK